MPDDTEDTDDKEKISTPSIPTTSTNTSDVEKGEHITNLETEDDKEPLEKAIEKAPRKLMYLIKITKKNTILHRNMYSKMNKV